MSPPQSEKPLIVQGDLTVLLEVDGPLYEAARDQLARFAELVKSPEHIHSYRIIPLSIWNALERGEGEAVHPREGGRRDREVPAERGGEETRAPGRGAGSRDEARHRQVSTSPRSSGSPTRRSPG